MGMLLFEKASKAKIDAMLDLNLKGMIHLTHDFMPHMIKSGGHVVNIGSLGGKVVPFGFNVYSATKSGMLGFMAGLRLDMSARQLPVTFHCVMPGIVRDTGMATDAANEIGLPLSDATNVRLLVWL